MPYIAPVAVKPEPSYVRFAGAWNIPTIQPMTAVSIEIDFVIIQADHFRGVDHLLRWEEDERSLQLGREYQRKQPCDQDRGRQKRNDELARWLFGLSIAQRLDTFSHHIGRSTGGEGLQIFY